MKNLIRVLDSVADIGDLQNVGRSYVNSAVSNFASSTAGQINSAISNLTGGTSSNIIGFSPIPATAEQRPSGQNVRLKNNLEQYASFNCIFELGALSAFTVNNPQETYRLNGADVTILRSGGGGIDDKRAQTAYDALGKEKGNLEYFIDDVNISAIVSPSRRSGISQATRIEFAVHEPYSMGLFLQSVQSAALAAGFKNYLEAPYMLELDFIGWDDDGNAVPVENSNRKIPLKFANIEFDVERGGSVYKVSAYPWNEMALLDTYQVVADDVSISGPSVFETLTSGDHSLTSIINTAILTAAQAKELPASDTYLIRFPSSQTSTSTTETGENNQGATSNATESVSARLGAVAANTDSLAGGLFNYTGNAIVESLRNQTLGDLNDIGAAAMLNPDPAKISSNGDHPFGLGLYTWEENAQGVGVYKRDGVELSIDGDTRTFKFKQGTKISKIVEEIVLASEYGRTAIQSVNEEGMTPWFRIEPQVYILDNPAQEEITGRKPLIWVYNVVPYEVHISTFSAPNQDIGVQERSKQAVKEYDYIYSGNNNDVLGFDIKFNAAFFTAISADYGEQSAGERGALAEGMTQPENQAGVTQGGETSTDNPQGSTNRVANVGGNASGNYNIDRLQNIARNFHDALLNSDIDLITADLEIWGDPYYVTDSGMGNYNAERSTASTCINADGCADFQQGHVHIKVNFRTPIDYNQDGTMEFPEDTQAVKGFSGLYRVLAVNTEISKNRFTQTLRLLRERNQDELGAVEQQTASALRQSASAQNTNDQNNSEPAETTGQATGDRTTGTTAEGATQPLTDDGALANITSKKQGVTVQVAAMYQENFQGFMDELENDYGYEITALSGYRRTKVATSGNWSYHASGISLDINGANNRWIVPRSPDAPEPTDMPVGGTGSAMTALAAKYGLGWGGDWNSSTDSMHFSLAIPEGGTINWPREGKIPGEPPQPQPAATGDPAEVPVYDDAILRQQRAVSGTQPVSGGRGDGNAEAARRRADNAATATPNPASNPQGTASGLRPYLPTNIQDDRYDFNTGDKVKAILAAYRNN